MQTLQKSIFEGHLLKPLHHAPLLTNTELRWWYFCVVAISAGLLLSVFLLYNKKLLQLVGSGLSYTLYRQLQREGYSFFKFFSLSLTFIYLLVGSLFFNQLNAFYGWVRLPIPDFLYLPVFIFFIGLLVVIRRTQSYFIAKMAGNKKAFSDYFTHYSYNIKLEGIFLLPIVLLLEYTSLSTTWILMVGVAGLFSIFLIRICRAIIYGERVYSFSVFHIFLYLCAVEIIPLAVFIKVLVGDSLQFG